MVWGLHVQGGVLEQPTGNGEERGGGAKKTIERIIKRSVRV